MNILSYAMTLDAGGFTGPLGTAKSALAGLSQVGNVITGIKSSFDLVTTAVRGIIQPIQDAVTKAGDFEAMRNQFITLLGSVEKADERLRDLAQFADTTPFELPEVVEASRHLENYTKGALSSAAGLRMVGDVASGVNQPIDEVAMGIARAYDALANNKPLDSAAQLLRYMGVLTGDIQTKMENAGGGMAAWKILEQSMMRFTGNTERAAVSWNGLISTFNDSLSAVKREFGEPIINAFKAPLAEAIAAVNSLKEKAKEWGEYLAIGARVFIDIGKQGKLFEVGGQMLKLAAMETVNILGRGTYASFVAAGRLLWEVMAGAVKMLSDGHVWTGIGLTLQSIFYELLSLLRRGVVDIFKDVRIFGTKIMSDENVEDQNWKADSDHKEAIGMSVRAGANFRDASKAGSFDGLINALPTAFDSFIDAFKSMAGPFAKEIKDLKGGIGKYLFLEYDKELGKSKKEKADRDLTDKDRQDKINANKPGAADAPGAFGLGKPESHADNLAKIGGFVGGYGSAADHARKTADNTSTLIERMNQLIAKTHPPTLPAWGL